MKESYPRYPQDDKKILLALLPFWTPLIPPLGISCLKGFLEPHGYEVKTVDLNIENRFKNVYDEYFNLLKKYIPEDKRGNFLNTGHDVLQSHLMAGLNYRDEQTYNRAVHFIIQENFYTEVEEEVIMQLNRYIRDFYEKLERHFLDLLETEKPAVLGLSVYSHTLPASMFVFQLSKSKYPHILTVMGGAIFSQELDMNSPDFEFFLEKAPYIDKIIIGEGEKLFLKLLRNELPGSKRVYTLKDIQGEILDLSSAEIPDFSDFDLLYYPYLASYSSRSCPYQCSFCAETVYWGKYRKKPAKQIAEELTRLYRAHGSPLFLMCDSLLNPIMSELAEVLLESPYSLYWDGYLRADQQVGDMENTLLWRRGGFYRARLGVESGSQHILDLINKKITPGIIAASLSSLAHVGIKTTTYWIVGYPGETEEDFQQTLDFIEKLKDDIYEAECNPFEFFLTGQVESSRLVKKYNPQLLYPELDKGLLLLQHWTLDSYPSREETFKRINRFVQHCDRLGIPNPYTLQDLHKADLRWKELHPNAVPSIIQFKAQYSIDECKKVKPLIHAQKTFQQGLDFCF